MDDRISGKELNRKAATAGMFYIVTQILIRGITFLITPVYTRLVSTAQFGELRTYESWLLIMVPVFSLSLYRSVERAKYDYPETFSEYVSSVQALSFLAITIGYTIVTVFFRQGFMNLSGMDGFQYIVMILFTYGFSAMQYFQIREKQMMRYRASVIASAAIMIPATIVSVLLLWWGNHTGRQTELVNLRIIGYFGPQILGGIILMILLQKQGKAIIRRNYWKYALRYSLPLIPELLSVQIMNQSDKIMVMRMVGSAEAGMYALAANLSYIIWILEDAVWGAWLPWFYEKISREEKKDIQKPWERIILLFGFVSWALVMLGPEVIFLLGGSQYGEALNLVAPMVTGILLRFFSYVFIAQENYQKKTKIVAAGTVGAMILNVILNVVCIRLFGYRAAAYTTAFSFFVLFIVHGLLEKKICGMSCVSLKRMLLLALVFIAVNGFSVLLFRFPWYARWGLVLMVCIGAGWNLFPEIKDMVRRSE